MDGLPASLEEALEGDDEILKAQSGGRRAAVASGAADGAAIGARRGLTHAARCGASAGAAWFTSQVAPVSAVPPRARATAESVIGEAVKATLLRAGDEALTPASEALQGRLLAMSAQSRIDAAAMAAAVAVHERAPEAASGHPAAAAEEGAPPAVVMAAAARAGNDLSF